MPEWTKELRKRLSRPNLEPADEVETVEELAQYLESRAIQFEQSVQQNICAVGDVFGVRKFARGVADAGDARDEDHADWAETGHVLSIVAGARGH